MVNVIDSSSGAVGYYPAAPFRFTTHMLRLHLKATKDNILGEDLTGIVSDAVAIRKEHYEELKRLCQNSNGYAIAANQVGLRENFFFALKKAKFPINRQGAPPVDQLCVNPCWEPAPGSEAVEEEEGCLSLPGRRFLVMRYPVIIAAWNNAVGHRMKDKKLKGLAAQVFQHEHDHLRGVILSDHGKEVL